MVKNYAWHEDAVNLLKELWPDQKAKDIALAISDLGHGEVTRNAVIGKANRLGLSEPSKVMHTLSIKLKYAQNPGPGRCQWPLGDPQRDDFQFCGKEIRKGSPYCPDHRLLAYRRMQEN